MDALIASSIKMGKGNGSNNGGGIVDAMIALSVTMGIGEGIGEGFSTIGVYFELKKTTVKMPKSTCGGKKGKEKWWG